MRCYFEGHCNRCSGHPHYRGGHQQRNPIQQALILLALADSSGPLAMQELQAFARVSQASTSRNCAALSAWVRSGVPGYGLVESYDDPEYRRRKLVRLTPAGEVLRKKLKELG